MRGGDGHGGDARRIRAGGAWSADRLLRPGLLLALAVGAALVTASCDRKPSASAPPVAESTPVPQPEPGYVGVPDGNPPDPEEASGEASGQIDVPAEVNTNVADAENRLVKAEVLARIDVMPRLTPEEKDKLYVMVDRARGMGRIVTIPFSSGKVSIGAGDVKVLKEKIELPQIRRYSDDPTVVFVVLGFADKKGDPAKNVAISLDRAESVVKALKEKLGVLNVVHAVGMGSSEMFDGQNLDKNRVVEVWAVLP